MGIYRQYYPVGLSYLSASLNRAGHKTLIFDGEHDVGLSTRSFRDSAAEFPRYLDALKNKHHPLWKEVRSVIEDVDPDVIGIGMIAEGKYGSTLCVAEIVKEWKDEVTVIVGGHLPTTKPELLLSSPNIDVVVRGEGELTVLELVNNLHHGNPLDDVLGISYKEQDRIIHNPDRPLIAVLDESAFPDIESIINFDTYRPVDLGVVVTSRGCPYSCSFCAIRNLWGQKVRYHSIEYVIEEIRRLVEKHNVGYISFRDPTFNLDRKRVIKFCEALHRENLKIEWECFVRIDRIDKTLLDMMKQAGCYRVRVGVESGSDRIHKYLNKGLTVAKIRQGAAILNSSGIRWTAFVMIGIPEETEDDLLATLELLKEIQPTFVNIALFNPIPGTRVYQELLEEGVICEPFDYSQLGFKARILHFSKHISDERFQELMDLAISVTEEINAQNYLVDFLTKT